MPTAHPYRKGQIILIALVFFAILMIISAALIGIATNYARLERIKVAAAEALYLAEAGVDKAAYELNQNPNYTGEAGTMFGGGEVDITVTGIDANTKQVTVTSYYPDSANPVSTRIVKVKVALNSDVVSFHYGIQAGNGGFTLANSSTITGNVFSSGPVIGAGNSIFGDVLSSGASGLVYGVHATGTVYAHTVGNAAQATTVDKDAYYVAKTNTTVTGTLHPGSPDQPSAPLPISDAQITEWEDFAALGGTIAACDGQGNYTISSTMSLGPKKIACNLVVKSANGVLTVTGPIWVTGNITTQTGPTIRIDPALGSQNVAIIADNPANTTGSGKISVGQSTIFQGSGAAGSFVFLISQNNSAETGGAVVAVDMSQGANALVAYAAHGLLTLSQSVGVKEATGYKIALSQSANVVYDTGLPSTVFESGPGGSWTFVPGTYVIAQ